MTKFRKLATAFLFAPVAALAEGQTSALDTAINEIQTGVTGLVDKIVPAVGTIIVAGLVFWGLRALVRWASRYFGK